MGVREEVAGVLATGGGVFAAARHPHLSRAAQRMAAAGELRRLLPGVYGSALDPLSPELRIRAAAAWAPSAVLTGAAAARLSFWPTVGVETVTMSTPVDRIAPPGIRLERERIPPELVAEIDGCRITRPALTALDLALNSGGEAIDRVLRLRVARLDDLAEALRLTNGRRGNLERRRWLLDSRDDPWSEAEREGHRLLREAGIAGWRGNLPVACGPSLFYLDIGFRKLKLGIEIDGREVHTAENVVQFVRDRHKWTTLALHRWMLLHFAATHVFDEPAWFVDCVREAEATLRRGAA